MKTIFTHITTLVLGLTSALLINAQMPGDLDSDFGIGGYVYNDNIANEGEIYLDMITMSDDKILMVGFSSGDNQDIILAKFLADGSPDPDFGTDGFQSIDASLGLNEQAWGVEELQDGKILITGIIVTAESWDGFIMRLNSDGSVDGTFGETASGRTNFNAGDNTIAMGRDIEILAGNAILVGGTALFDNQSDMVVFKFTVGGGLDQSFASGGSASIDVLGEADEVEAMALTSNGQIVLAGTAQSGDDEYASVAVLTSFGTPTSFAGGEGHYTFDVGSGQNEIRDVYVDENDKIVAVGAEGVAPDVNGMIIRLNLDGTLDEDFSDDGMTFSDPGLTTEMRLTSAIPTANGGVLATGFSSGPGGNLIYAFMMDNDGGSNTDFGGNGEALHGLSIASITMNGMCASMQSDGAIVIGGYVTSQDFIGENMYLLRLHPVQDDTSTPFLDQHRNLVQPYPNPATDYFRLDISGDVETIELRNSYGSLVRSWTPQPQYQIPSELAPGAYLIQAVSGSNRYVSTLMITQ